jgi:CRISPR-associated protein Csb2
MPILTVTFPGGRYHATPWGAHVNESQVEWPPSPWRVCRALLATGMSKLGWREDDLPFAAYELIDGLSRVLPEYQLPAPITVAHTRHYMPIPGNTTKVFDGFAHLGDQPLRISWAVDLSPAALALLQRLVAAMSYLGRAESWIDAALTDGALAAANCRPCASPELLDHEEPVTLLAPLSADAFQAWRAAQADLAAAGSARRGKGKAGAPSLPTSLLDCMLRGTDELQRQGWSSPPGSRRVLYARPRDALVAAQPARPRPLRLAREPVECALLALSSYAVRGDVLPGLELAVPQAEALHRALAKLLGAQSCPELTGRTDDRTPLQAGHRHAHYIPLDLRGRGGIDHILVYAPQGLGERAQAVLGRLSWIVSAAVSEQSAGDDHERRQLTTTLVATGDRQLLHHTLAGHRYPALLGASRTWESHTPFVAPRFVKDKHPIEEQVRAELRSRGLETPVRVEVLPHQAAVDAGFLRYVRHRRRNKPQPPTTRPWRLRLHFDEPVQGPLALGYASHFGLGLFRPVAESAA